MNTIDNLPSTGFVRLSQILGPKGPLPISRSTWYAGQKTGRFPKPVKLGPRAVGYRVEEIRQLLSKFGDQPLDIHRPSSVCERDTAKVEMER
jgi:prophage regulatory protein